MNWFALNVRARCEKDVANRLSAKSLEAYLPLYKFRQRWSDRWKILEVPLFTRYVFCQFNVEERFAVLNTPGVQSVVGFSGIPCHIPDADFDNIRRIVQSGVPLAPWPIVRVGDSVRISGGPLVGLEGVLTREKRDYRVVINVDLLDSAIAIEVERDLIESVASFVSRLPSAARANETWRPAV